MTGLFVVTVPMNGGVRALLCTVVTQ